MTGQKQQVQRGTLGHSAEHAAFNGSPAPRLRSVCKELLLISISQATAKSLPRTKVPSVHVKFLPASDDILLIFYHQRAPGVFFPPPFL